jgi:cytochrome c oxidase subunit 1
MSHPAPPRTFIGRYIFSTDHKVIGLQFLASSLLFLAVGGLLALAIRWQLAWPWSPMPVVAQILGQGDASQPMPPETYNKLFTLHGTIMVFFVIIPLLTGAFGNYLIPLMIGARDMALPRLNMLSFWLVPLAFALIVASWFVEGGAAESGWTAYPPLSVARWAAPGSLNGQTLWLASLLLVGVSSLAGSINYVTTVLTLRCPGMRLFRMPMTIWALFITALLQCVSLPVLTCALVMQLLDRVAGTQFFIPPGLTVGNAPAAVGGGQALLYQHLFWFYSHPAVYVMILPAMGMVSDILSTFSRKPLFGYKPMVVATGTIAVLGFLVWGHHMFQSGMNPYLGTSFALSTMLIAVPSAIKVFNWIGTMWGGNLQPTCAMLNAIAFVSMFIIGGLSGIYMAATPVDMHIHDTYFIVAHIHYALFGGSLFAVFAALFYWFPKMTGRMLGERLGKLHFLLTFITFNGTFLLMHVIGYAGHPRRIADWSAYEFLSTGAIVGMNRAMTYFALALGASQLLLVVDLLLSLAFGRRAGENPWHANTLEWSTTSPPPGYNFETIPVVYHPPYEYSVPGVAGDDYLPQTRPRPPEAGALDPIMA